MFRNPSNFFGAGGIKAGATYFSQNPFTEVTPDLVDGLDLWFTGDSTDGTNDGDPIASWDDISGAAVSATQTNGSKKPTLQTNELNGYSVVRFDGTDHMDYTPPSSFDGATIFYVISGSSATMAGNNGILCWATTGYDYAAGDSMTINTGYLSPDTPSGQDNTWRATFHSPRQETYSFREWHIGCFRVGGGNMTTTINGTELVSNSTVASMASSPTVASIGSRVYIGASTGNIPYLGDMAEIIVYNTDIGATDQANIEAYLNNKYLIY